MGPVQEVELVGIALEGEHLFVMELSVVAVGAPIPMEEEVVCLQVAGETFDVTHPEIAIGEFKDAGLTIVHICLIVFHRRRLGQDRPLGLILSAQCDLHVRIPDDPIEMLEVGIEPFGEFHGWLVIPLEGLRGSRHEEGFLGRVVVLCGHPALGQEVHQEIHPGMEGTLQTTHLCVGHATSGHAGGLVWLVSHKKCLSNF